MIDSLFIFPYFFDFLQFFILGLFKFFDFFEFPLFFFLLEFLLI